VKRDQAIGRLEREGETNEVLEREVGAIAGEEKRIIEVLEGIRQDVKTREEEVRLAWRGEKAKVPQLLHKHDPSSPLQLIHFARHRKSLPQLASLVAPQLKVKIQKTEKDLAKITNTRLKGEARKKEIDDFLSVVLTLNQELVGASSSPQKAERSRRDAYEVRDDGTFEAGGRAGERAFRANVGLEADRLLDWNGRKLGEGLERVMEDVYQRLMRDRRGIIVDDAKSVRSEDVREAYKGGLLGRMGMVKLAGESLETAR
jgi:hypothetical protein